MQSKATKASNHVLKTRVPHRVLQNLKHQDWRVSKEATVRLQEVETQISLPILATMLRDENPFVGEAACEGLEHIGRTALPTLIEALNDKSIRVRGWIVWTFRQIGDANIVPNLIEALNDTESIVQYRAFQALQKFRDSRALPALMDILKSPDKERRNEALETLIPFGNIELLPFCLNIIENEDPGEYELDKSARLAAKAIGKMGSSVLDVLSKLAQDKRTYVRKYAAEALGILQTPIANPTLFSLLKDGDSNVQVAAIHALGWFGNNEAIEPLLALDNNPDRNGILSLPSVLGDIGNLIVVPFLMRGLHQERDNMDVGLYAQAITYWRWKERGVAVIPETIHAIKNSQDQTLRISAVWLLHKPLYEYQSLIESWVKAKKPVKQLEIPEFYVQTLDILRDALSDPNPDIRLSAIAINYIGFKDRWTVGAITARLNDEIPLIVRKAAEQLLHTGNKRSIKKLIEATNHPDEKVQAISLQALGRIGQAQALPIILEKLNHPSEKIRHAAAASLRFIHEPEVFPILLEKFQHEQNSWVRNTIVSSIGQLKTKEALSFLLKLLNEKDADDDPYWSDSIRGRAVYALIELNAAEALPDLFQALEKYGHIGSMAHMLVNAIGGIGTDEEKLSRLFGLLTHASSFVRETAATRLGYIGAAIQDLQARDRLVQELINILYDTGRALHYAAPLVGDAVAKSLYYIGTPEAHTAYHDWHAKRASIIADLQSSDNEEQS